MLSKYRMQLFAIGTIGVLAVHSNEYIEYSKLLKVLMSYGGIGVYLFAFLSGIGLYCSMSRNEFKENSGILDFYKRRLVRVAIPYTVIAFIWYGIKYLFIERDVLSFMYEFSTMSFWLEHKGAWYVAMLIPLYVVYPWYYQLCKKTNHLYCGGVSVLVALSGVAVCAYFNRNLYDHLQQVFNSLIIFLIGDMYGDIVDSNRFKERYFAIVMILLFVVGMKTPIENVLVIEKLSRPLLAVGLTIITAYILDLIKENCLHKSLKFIGKYSLEIYLTNIFLIQADRYFGWEEKIGEFIGKQYSNSCMYIFIVVVGIIISIFIGEACRGIFTVKK